MEEGQGWTEGKAMVPLPQKEEVAQIVGTSPTEDAGTREEVGWIEETEREQVLGRIVEAAKIEGAAMIVEVFHSFDS